MVVVILCGCGDVYAGARRRMDGSNNDWWVQRVLRDADTTELGDAGAVHAER